MNLIKDPKDPNRLKSDLDTIQRDFGVLSGTITAMQAQIAALQVKTTFNPPVIQPNSVVKNYHGVDPTVPIVPFGGSTPVPLVASPDVQVVNIPNLNFLSLHTTPLIVVPAITGKVILPIMCAYEVTCAAGTANFTNGNTGCSLGINSSSTVNNTIIAMGGFALGGGANTRFLVFATGATVWNTAAPVGANEHFTGKPLKLFTTNDISNPGGAGPATVNMSIVYWVTTALTLFS
jgi:hypothetical protein